MQDPSIPSITRNDAILYSNTNNTLLNTLNNVGGGRRRQRGGVEPLYKQSGTDITVVNANMATTGEMQVANSDAFVNPVIKSLFGGKRRKTRRMIRRKQTKKRRRQRTRK